MKLRQFPRAKNKIPDTAGQPADQSAPDLRRAPVSSKQWFPRSVSQAKGAKSGHRMAAVQQPAVHLASKIKEKAPTLQAPADSVPGVSQEPVQKAYGSQVTEMVIQSEPSIFSFYVAEPCFVAGQLSSTMVMCEQADSIRVPMSEEDPGPSGSLPRSGPGGPDAVLPIPGYAWAVSCVELADPELCSFLSC